MKWKLLSLYIKFYDNYINTIRRYKQKDVEKMLFERCIIGCGYCVWLELDRSMGYGGSYLIIVQPV